MNTAWELIQKVERAGGQFVVNGDLLGICPAIAARSVLEQVRRRKVEIITLLNSRAAFCADVQEVRCWSEWLLDECDFKCGHWAEAGPLQLSLARWCTAHGRPVAVSRRAFVAALRSEGFHITSDGLVYGLSLKADMDAQGRFQESPAAIGTPVGPD